MKFLQSIHWFWLWRPGVDLFNILNLYVDPVRFQQERLQVINEHKNGRSQHKKYSYSNDESLNANVKTLNLASIFQSFRRLWRTRKIQLSIHIIVWLLDCFNLFKSIMFVMADQQKDENLIYYTSPWLVHMKNWYIYDIFVHYPQSHNINRTMAFVLANYLIIKLISMRNILRQEIFNRTSHCFLNSIQFHSLYSFKLYGSFWSWHKLIWTGLVHQCDLTSPEALRHYEKMRLLNESTKSLDSIDRHFNNNLIDFGPCMNKFGFKVDTTTPIKYNGNFHLTDHSDHSRRINPRHAFLPKPYHRMDPKGLAIEMIVSYFGLILMTLGVSISYFELYIHALAKTGYQFEDTFPANLIMFLSPFETFHYFVIFMNFLSIIVIHPVNIAHIACFVSTGLTYMSRTNRVLRYLIIHNEGHYDMIRKFNKFASTRTLLGGQGDCLNSCFPTGNSTYDQETLKYPCHYFEDLTLIKREFCAQLANSHKARRLRCDLVYSLDLLGVLRKEFNDLKQYFTNYINVYLSIGTLALSLSINILLNSQCTPERLTVLCISIISLIPMIFSFTMAAFSEYYVSNG